MNTASKLWFYRAMVRFTGLGYRGKILFIALVGIQVPVLASSVLLLSQESTTYPIGTVLAFTLLIDLLGSGFVLLALDQLLRPVHWVSQGLHDYLRHGHPPEFPQDLPGEGGRLMAEVSRTLNSLEEAVQQLRNFDAVTGLPNRNEFQRLLHNTLQQDGDITPPLAVITVQLKDFDRMLGTFGQDKVDRLLRTLAARLNIMTTDHWELGRLESDCLAILRTDAVDPEMLAAEIDLCLKRLSAPVVDGQTTLVASLQAGIALAPTDGDDAETLIQNTFTALLEKRTDAASSVAFFSQETRAALLERHMLEQELRHALNTQQFELHFQPVVDVKQQTVASAEALLRWKHPEFGDISPAQFIPVAEACGLMEKLGAWVIHQACAQLHQWHQMGYEHLHISVNLSARQFSDFGLIDLIGENLLRYDLPPGSLEVELTESVATHDATRTQRILEALRTMGVMVAIDDFGTGSASMSQLRQLPLDKIKIDGEFVKNMATPAICQSLISLSKSLGLAVVAEGVETAEEMAMLRDRGCQLFQGHLFSPAMDGAGFSKLLQESSVQQRLLKAVYFQEAMSA